MNESQMFIAEKKGMVKMFSIIVNYLSVIFVYLYILIAASDYSYFLVWTGFTCLRIRTNGRLLQTLD
jgi:uncharacterized membrane protein